MLKFSEAKLESAFIDLLDEQSYPHHLGVTLKRAEDEVLIEDDLQNYLLSQYKAEGLTITEVKSIILQLKSLPASDLYESNKTFMRMLSDGFALKREDRNQKDIWIYLIDYSEKNNNTYKFVNHLVPVS